MCTWAVSTIATMNREKSDSEVPKSNAVEPRKQNCGFGKTRVVTAIVFIKKN